MQAKEVWADVKGYEGLYQVSTLGRVKSVRRKQWCVKNNSFSIRKERIMKASPDGSGYLCLSLNKNGKGKTINVHRISAYAFLNHSSSGMKMVVDHIDNDKLNNRLDNLQIITHRENTSKDREGYSSKYIGVYWCNTYNKWFAKITINNKPWCKSFHNEYEAHLAIENHKSKYL